MARDGLISQMIASFADPNIAGRTTEGRTKIRNADQTVSSELSATVGFDEGYVNIPTMFRGKKFSVNEAIEIMKKNKFVDPDTGRKLPFFNTEDEAIQAAQKRTKEIQ
jgi:hypothetical protein